MQSSKLPRSCRTVNGKPKVRYMERAEAKRYARIHGTGEKVYRCPHCGYFHLGHKSIELMGKCYASMGEDARGHCEAKVIEVKIIEKGGQEYWRFTCAVGHVRDALPPKDDHVEAG